MNKEELKTAVEFHNLYERFAPDFGYETRKETRKFDPETPNGKLMLKVCSHFISKKELESVIEGMKLNGMLVDVQRVVDIKPKGKWFHIRNQTMGISTGYNQALQDIKEKLFN